MAQQITVARPVPQQPRRHSPWVGRIFLAVALTLVAALIASVTIAVVNSFSSSAPAQPAQTEVNIPAVPAAPAVVDVQVQIEPVPVVPTTPLELEWVEIGRARNGSEVLALPIPWDRVVIDRGTANMPDGTNKIIDFLRYGNYTLPPAKMPLGEGHAPPTSKVSVYLVEGEMVTFYGYSDYHWTVENPHGLAYWKARALVSEVEELSP
ncbi:MAG: hypothetical protein HYU04_00500 [Candidatus Wildermuthbacteria bacterium]|nr:hypothetical protein [Candidatus Wildermuthbacteria bacterium]